ncbi:MAG: hypothetical protein R3C28_13815 [Pirellulaceae bacterium]
MVIVAESARRLKTFIGNTYLGEVARTMVLRLVLTFITHRGRMSVSVSQHHGTASLASVAVRI